MPDTFDTLTERYGRSAATTYWWNRLKGTTAAFALRVMRRQVIELGCDYAGGFDCVPFRRAYRTPEMF